MDEHLVRQAVAKTAHELWLRGLMVGDGGLVCAELNRRRYLVTPPGTRRAGLDPQAAMIVDLSGEACHGTRPQSIAPRLWQPCMLALQASARQDPQAIRDTGTAGVPEIRACIICTPPSLTAVSRLSENDTLNLNNGQALPIIEYDNAQALTGALGETKAVWLRGIGLFVPAASLPTAANIAEHFEHEATITLAMRRA